MKLTDEQKQIKIAEACGWKFCAPNPSWPTPYWTNPVTKELSVFAQLPDYLNDLNAMHEAEKVAGFHADTSEGRKLTQKYAHLIGTECESWKGYATAAQRAEAFLKTLNLWTE